MALYQRVHFLFSNPPVNVFSHQFDLCILVMFYKAAKLLITNTKNPSEQHWLIHNSAVLSKPAFQQHLTPRLQD